MKLVYFLPLLAIVVVPAFANIGFMPVYQPNGGTGASPNELYCIFGEFLNSYNATTNNFTCAAGGGGGENNTASNVGLGEDIFKQKTGVNLEFKGIATSGDLSISSNATDIIISYTDPPGGSGNATLLDHLGDVVITSPANLSVLFYDGLKWLDKIFTVNSITCGAGQFVNVINNQTGTTSCATPSGSGNMTVLGDAGDATITSPASLSILQYVGSQWIDKIFSINTQSATNGNFITGINNQTGTITTQTFKVFTTTCSGTDKVSAINNSTGAVTCTTDSGGGGSGIPLPPKKWGELIPRSASTSLQGLLTGCTILATATFVYDTTDNSNAILSTTATTDGINGGIHCSIANTNSFRGDQNAYLYAKWEANKITTNRIFIGFQSGATHLPNNADTILDALDGAGLCIRTTDTVYQFCSNDGTGATAYATMTTTEDTGVHYVEIYTTNAGVTWCGKLDGGTAVCSSTSTDIPTPTDRLYVNSTGETDGGASAILWTQYLLYVQNDK